MKTFRLAVVSCVALGVSLLSACGGDGGGGGGIDDPTKASLPQLMQSINEDQFPETSVEFKDLVEAEQAMLTVDTADGGAVQDAANDLLAALEAFAVKFGEYDEFLTEYQTRVLNPGTKVGTTDPVASIPLASLLQACDNAIDTCDDFSSASCQQSLMANCSAESIDWAASVQTSSGQTFVTGITLATAPVSISVVPTGVSLNKGADAGLFFSYCETDAACALNLVSTELQSGASESSPGTIYASLFQGTGTLHVNIVGCAPIVLSDVTIGTSGAALTVECVSDSSTSETAVAEATTDSAQTGDQPVDDGTGTCGSIASISVSTDPPDPGPGENVTVFADVLPSSTGCAVTYTVDGTDGYQDSGTLSTAQDGTVSFFIPGGAEGVVDTVTVSANGRETTITYAF